MQKRAVATKKYFITRKVSKRLLSSTIGQGHNVMCLLCKRERVTMSYSSMYLHNLKAHKGRAQKLGVTWRRA